MAKINPNIRRAGLVLLAVVLAVVAYAWINGGQEPIHPITQNVDLPEGVQ